MSNISIKDIVLLKLLKQEKFEKREVREPNIDFLKGMQKEGFELISKFVHQESDRMFCLEGFAGTGKSTLVAFTVEYIFTKYRTKTIAMTAPTNKAVRELFKKCEFTHTNLKFNTIHSLLGLKESIDDDGNQVFVRDFEAESKIDEVDFLIVDEVSMLQDDLFEMLLPYTYKKLKIVFVGDSAQIPPIGKKDCIPFSEEMRREYGIRHFKMTSILRQAEDNPIIKISMILRENVKKPAPFVGNRKTQIDGEGKGVIFLDKSDESSDLLFEMLSLFFDSDNFKENSDFVKVIAWTNKCVDSMNKIIRSIIYKKDKLPKLLVGEKLIANKVIVWGDDILFTTNSEFEVVSFTQEVEDINNGQFMLKYYNAVVIGYDDTETKTIRIIHEDSEEDYNKILKDLAYLAKREPRGSVTSKKFWQMYYEFLKHYADVKYNYCLTAHKSQGSTYTTAIVMENNINKSTDVVERNRIKYTAVTRPTSLLVIVN